MNKNVHKNLLTFLLSISMVCLVFSKYVLSVSLIGILMLLLFLKEDSRGFSLGLNPKIFQPSTYRNFWPFTGFVLFFFWIVLSLLWSGGEFASWLHDVQSKLTIIGVAVLFALLPKFENFRILVLHQVFGGTILISLLLILYVYIPGYEEITFLIGRGRPIPTPIDHVRFSIMVAYACLSFIAILLESASFGLRQKEKVAMLILSVVFFCFSHLLAVRTGLLLLYIGLALIIFHFILTRKKYIIGLAVLLTVSTLPIIAFYFVESFYNKVYYTKYDIEQMLLNNGANYSDGDRIRSIQHGIELWKNHPWLGYGAGQYKQANIDLQEQANVQGKVLLPHNQYVRTGMAYGWLGLILLLSGFGLIFVKQKALQNLPLLIITTLLIFSLFVESNLDRYYALAFFMMFLGINSRIARN